MPKALINGVDLYYEETGTGTPVVFVHEFASDYRGWEPQVRFFSRRYRCVTYNARGYPPSGVPESPSDYSQDHAVGDLLGLMDHLGLERAHIVGFSMGGYCSLIFGLKHPDRARSLVVAGCGYGSDPDRTNYERDVKEIAAKMIGEGMEVVAEFYSRGPTRVQFIETDPRGWREFHDRLSSSSGLGHGNTMLGVQMNRPTVPQLIGEMKKLTVPTLIMTGDEDEPCLEPGLLMKRTIPSAALVVMPKCGHGINLEAPDAFNGHLADFFGQVDAGRWTLRNPASLSQSSMLPPDKDHG